MKAKVQSFENHGSNDVLYFGSGIVAIGAAAAAIVDAAMHPSLASITQAIFGLMLVVLFLRLRRYALTVQDRVIRLETRLRFERVLGPELFARIHELTLKQIIALRFASDDELPALFLSVVNKEITAPKEIKQRIKHWQADWLRV